MKEIVNRIILDVQKGDQNAFGDLIDLYQNKVYSICYRLIGNRQEAEDLTQETFLRAYLNLDSYQADKKFSSWLFRIATNVTIDRLRKKKPDYSLDAEISGTDGMTMYTQLASDGWLPEEEAVETELKERLHGEIMQLPPKYRAAIVLKYIEDLSLKEIAEILNLPLATVKTRIHRGREALRKRLNPEQN
ncbi:MAG TPA: RNA polymerase sigma factor SigW [Bacillales bacterium]|nr:RNA polymerase sigma factor SigW [Bacillales bacterium]